MDLIQQINKPIKKQRKKLRSTDKHTNKWKNNQVKNIKPGNKQAKMGVKINKQACNLEKKQVGKYREIICKWIPSLWQLIKIRH